MSIRVLHVGKYWPPFWGGIETFMADLLPAQSRLGMCVGALVHDHSIGRGAVAAGAVEGDVRIWRVPSYGRMAYAPVAPSFLLWFERVVREFEPDLIHLHLPNTSAFWGLVSPAAKRRPWVVHWHSDVVASEHDRKLAHLYPLYKPFERAVLRRSARVVATSPPYLDTSAALALYRDRVEVVPLGMDPARIPLVDDGLVQQTRQRWPSGGVRLLTIGRLTYYKGHEVLLRALSRTEGASLVLVGEGEGRVRLEGLARELGVAGRVLFTGRLPEKEVHAFLEAGDLFCLPSLERTEAFGVVLIEAMAHGRAALVSSIPGSGVGWVVRDGVEGIHARPGDVDNWAEAIGRVAAAPERLRQLGEAGRERYQRSFRIDRVAERLEGIYRELLSEGRKG
ncbi:glycosyltransferase [Endothiovibrio diazotrophicus]